MLVTRSTTPESIEAFQAATSIAWTIVGISIVWVELLNSTLIHFAINLETDGAAESRLRLIVAELDEVAILAADIDTVWEVAFADVLHIDIVLLLLAVNTRRTGRKSIELVLVEFGCLVSACKA